MEEFIKALSFLSQFVDKTKKYPVHCGHEVLYIYGVQFDSMTAEDVRKLDELGFGVGHDDDYSSETLQETVWTTITDEQWQKIKGLGILTGCVHSFKWGSC